jgi:predicted nucleotidyltransferase
VVSLKLYIFAPRNIYFFISMNLRQDYTAIVNHIREVGSAGLPKGSHIVLYGSRARGDAKDGSDWDLLVLLDKDKIEQSDYDGICYNLTALGWELGEMIIPVLYTKDEWQKNSFTPFYKNVVSEGIEII